MGGAQELIGIKPDITFLGKIIGGGFPVGAYGAREEIMQFVSPDGPVYQAGTLSGNPVAMAAGLATISLLNRSAYSKLDALSALLEDGLLENAENAGVDVTINRVGSMLGLFFTDSEVKDFRGAKKTDRKRYARFHRVMLEGGIYLPPSALETIFLSTAHSKVDVEATLAAARNAFKESVAS
jgi:glutamate-1-semialdehyde 2,1-aminomutase